MAAALLPNPALQPNPVELFLEQAYAETLDQINRMAAEGYDFLWRQTGIVHLPSKARIRKICDKLAESPPDSGPVRYLDPAATTEITGLPLDSDALYYPLGGHLNPPALCKAFTDREDIQINLYKRVDRLEGKEQGWQVFCDGQESPYEAEIVVLANGFDILKIAQTSWMPLARARGQVAYLPADQIMARPKTVICHEGYMIPHLDGCHLLGATLDYKNSSPELSHKDHAELMTAAAGALPGFQTYPTPPTAGRVSFRTNSPDHLPLVGALPDLPHFCEAYADLHHGRTKEYPPAPVHSGLYCSTGHGSRGMITAWPAACLLAQCITGANLPYDQELIKALHPARFLIRALKRKPDGRITRLRHPKA